MDSYGVGRLEKKKWRKNGWKIYRTGSKQQEDETWKELADFFASWDTEKSRTCSFSSKKWQPAQSSATKAENLENDFTEATAKAQNWVGRKARTTQNAGWNRTKAVTREVNQVRGRGAALFLGRPKSRQPFHVFDSSNSMTKQVKTKCG